MNMKTAAICAITFLLGTPVQAQERAVTGSGRAVLLNADGTWRNADTPKAPSGDDGIGSRPAGATAKLELGRTGYALFYDATKWALTSEKNGRSTLQHSSGEAYAGAISERISVPMNNLAAVALQIAKQAAPDAKFISQSTRLVNGKTVIVARMSATVQGMPFIYLNYYYSGKAGTVQILTYTGANIFPEYEPEFEQLLNGLTVND